MFKGSMVALVTPFGEDQKIDYTTIKNLIEKHIQEGTEGIVIAGTTGESPTLEGKEFQELVSFVIEEVNKRIPVIAGTGTNCTKKTVETTRLAKELGADGAMIVMPYYNKPTDRGVLAHFREITKLEFPLIPYHHPSRCGIELDVLTLIELAGYDWVVAIKDCSNNRSALRELLEKRPQTIVLSGNDEGILDMIRMQVKGCISVVANVIPAYWNKMIHKALQGEFAEAEAMYQEVKTLLWAISLEVNPQGIKCAMAEEGLCSNVLRLPLVAATEDSREEIQEALHAFDFITN